MKPGERELNGATLEVNVCQGVPPRMRRETREITGVYVPASDRKKGLASALMHQVCDEADQANITLLLTCRDELRRWYARYGFMVLQDDIGILVRAPGSTPKLLTPLSRAMDGAFTAMH